MLVQPWNLQLLGEVVLSGRGERIAHFPTRKTASLLAYIAVSSSEACSREIITELFWSESEPEQGRASLRQALAALRRLLEPPGTPAGSVLVADRTFLHLPPDTVQTDVHAFENAVALAFRTLEPTDRLRRFTEADALYKGEFLPGSYDDWALNLRRRLQNLYRDVLHEQAAAAFTLQEYALVQMYGERLLASDPFDEDAQALLMKGYAAQGNLARLRRQFQELTGLLQKELKTTPSPVLQTLYARLESAADKSLPLSHTPAPFALPAMPISRFGLEETDAEGSSPCFRLPLFATRFFGREAERTFLEDALSRPDIRLLTITGVGGMGKTRLAVEAAKRAVRFDTVTFVPLADVSDAADICPAILRAAGIPVSDTTTPLDQIAAVLQAQAALLLLDNMEQLVETGAETVQRLLERVAGLTLLVTSRQLVGLPGEQDLPLSPLPMPVDMRQPDALIANPTVQMLVDRMRSRRAAFQVTAANAAQVAALCTRLEGVPLAVELAAGWARDLTVGQMLERLDNRFDLLVSRQRGVPSRHLSLRATVQSSVQILPPELQAFLFRLSVFRGGWTTDTAEIALSETEAKSLLMVEERLRQLQERSLLVASEDAATMRYRMLETLREYGQEQLTPDEKQTARARHTARFTTLAEDANGFLRGPQQIAWLDRLESERDNLRLALAFCLENDSAQGLRLANALYWFWYVRGYHREGEQWFCSLLTKSPPEVSRERASALRNMGHLANCQGDNTAALSHYTEALALFTALHDVHGRAHTLCRMGNALQEGDGDITEALRLSTEGVALFRQINDTPGLIVALFYHGNIQNGSRFCEGEAAFIEALALAEQRGDLRYQAVLYHCMGTHRKVQGDTAAALRYFRDSLRLKCELREPLHAAYTIRELARIFAEQGRHESAARLLGAREGISERLGRSDPLSEQQFADELRLLVEQGLPPETLRIAWEYGRSLDFTECLALAHTEIARL